MFFAGGVGITPILSMLRTLAERKDTRPCILFYGSKSREEILFREEIADFESALNLRVIHVLSDPEDDWEGDTGFLTPDLLDRELPETPGDYDYYICDQIVYVLTTLLTLIFLAAAALFAHFIR